jgi:hypothetical protein
MAKTNTAENEAEAGVEFEDGESYTFNMKDTEESSGFAPLPAATYLVSIDEVKFGLSKSSQSPTWYLTYTVAEGEFAEKNRKIFDILSLKADQQGRVKRFINRVAPELSEVENFNPKKVAEDGLLVGKQLKVKVSIEKGTDEYPGDKNRVKDHFAPGAATGGAGGGFQM